MVKCLIDHVSIERIEDDDGIVFHCMRDAASIQYPSSAAARNIGKTWLV